MVIHVRVFGVEVITIDVDLPTPAQTLDAVDDAVDGEVAEHWQAVKRWFR